MKNKEEFITEEKVINTPAGGVLIGKDKDGQTIIPNDGSLGGFLIGRLHKDGGIKAINKGTGQPLEMQSNEVVITAPAVSDTTKREFEGKMMTNREILSKINSDGGGVSFADGGDIPAKIHTTDCEYKFGGKVVKDTDIAHSLGMNSTLKKGKQQFSSGDTTYDVDGIYNAIKKGKLRLKTKEVKTFPMKYPVYDKKYSETVKTDFRKPNGITVRTESGEEVLIDGNHRMNNAYLKGRKTMKTYYIEDPKQIAKFTKKNKFELGGEYKSGGHLSKGKSLKQIAEMHNVSLAHINEELAKGLEVEKEHFTDFKERTRVAKDHLVENPNYYTILAKAGLKMGGHIQRQDLVEKSKKGDTPARDLNNYNDVMDLEADGAVGGDSGLAFAKGGVVYDTTKPKIEKVTIKSTMYGRASIVGRNASNVSELKDIIIDYVRNSTDDEDMIIFYVNDNTRGSYSINLNKGKKNTVKNVNTETVNAQNIKRVIDAKDYLVKNYDWTDFFSGTQKSSFINKKENSPDLVRLEYSLKGSQLYIPFRTGVDLLKEFFKIEKYCIENPNESVNVKIIAEVTDSTGVITATERNITFGEKHFKPRNWTNTAIENLMTKDWFSDKLDFTDFFKSSSKNLTSTKTLLTKDELFNSKIWIGDDVNLKKKVIQKLQEIGIPFDKKNGNPDAEESISINIYDFDFVVYKEPKEEFNRATRWKEFFPEDLGIDVTTMSVAPINANVSTSIKPFDFSMTKIDVSNNPELSQKVQKRAFELGWEWENNGGKTIDYNDFNYLYFTKTTISYGNTTSSFLKSPKRKITEEEIFGSQAPASVQKTNVVNSVRLNFEKQDGTPYDKITATSGKELFKELDYAENNWLSADDDFFRVWFIAYYTDENGNINSISESFNFGDKFFVPSEWSYDKFKEIVYKDWFNNKLDFSEFFDKTYIASSGLFNFTDTKIWIGDNPELSRRVQEKAFQSGWEWTDEGKNILYTDKKVLFFRKDGSIGFIIDADKKDFDAVKYREITEQDIFGSQTTNNAKPIVSKIRIRTQQKNNPSLANIKDAKSFDEFFTILKSLVEIKDTLQDDVMLMIYDDDDNVKSYDISLTLEKDMFDLLTDIEAKENLMDSLSANNQELDFKEFFSSLAQPLLTDLKSTKIFVNGDKELIEKVIKKAEQLGWNDNEVLKKQGNVSAIYFSKGTYVGWFLSEKEFKENISLKEIFPSDLGIDVNTSTIAKPTSSSAQPFNLANTKIWIGDNPELSKRVQEKAFELGWEWRSGKEVRATFREALFFNNDKIIIGDNLSDTKIRFNERNTEFSEIFPSDLGIGTSISNLSDERLKLLFDLKQIVDKENLEVLPANIESASSKQDDEEFIDLLDEEQLVVTFKKGKKYLNPTDERTSKILFEFFEFQKDFDSFSRKKAQELLSSYIADESKLYTTEFEKFEGDLSKAKKDLEDLKKLLPAFQQTKFAPQRALIINEIKKLNNKITKDGFIFTNELMSSANQLFTAQGLLKYYFDQTTQSPVQPLEPPCNLPTPNGMESKLPISAYFNVRTKQFKSWFGDWEKAYETNNYFDCSKMIDEETKEPKIYYHGVRKYIPNFGQFSNMGQGVVRPYGSFEPPTSFPASYFADNEEYAKFYGGVAKNMPKPSPDYEPFIYKVFLSVKNPLNLLPLGFEASYKDLLDYLFVAYGIKKTASANVLNRINNDMVSKHPVWVYVRNDISLLETIKEYGYDALIQIGDIPTFDEDGNPIDDRSKSMKEEEFLTFYPTQVKSATVLKSFYLDFFKDIRFNKGGYVRI